MGRIKQQMIEQMDTDEYIEWLEEQDDETTTEQGVGSFPGYNPTIAAFWTWLNEVGTLPKPRSIGAILANQPGPDSESE
jgi:hypothetical protein